MYFSNEIELMIACARVEVDPQGLEKIQQLTSQVIDWDKLVKECIRHKVLPLVFQNLTLICRDSFPENLKKQLEDGYIFENSLHNFSLVEQLFSVLELLKKNSIMAVPFKGPVLAQSLFGDFTLRRYLDLDIFISRKDAEKSVDILLSKGFIPERGSLPQGREKKKAYLEKIVNISLIHPDKHLAIDLQWDISNRFSNVPIVLEDLQERLEQVVLSSKNVPSLPPEELLCYLTLHGTKHRWLFLDMICCISELIRTRRDINWSHTEKFAAKIHCTNVLLLGLFIARDLLGAELPGHINKRIDKQKSIKKLAEKVYEGLFSNYMENMVTPEKFDLFLFQIKDGLSDKIRYCIKILFVPSKVDLRFFSLPESLSSLRYILRPIRLITEYGSRCIKTKFTLL